MTDSQCVFCKIVRGDVPARIVYENEHVLGFHDIQPVAPTHVLFIPKEHIADPSALDNDNAFLVGELFLAAGAVAERLGVAEQGYRLVMNKGKYGGQSVFHMHLHLLAGRRMSWPPG
ncbi:MAG: histidine triad nucleotide-binding protein [Anaerolineae bacterium]|nr:histidine triad nucleotide-binding protein [Anaerolineae bacterium]